MYADSKHEGSGSESIIEQQLESPDASDGNDLSTEIGIDPKLERRITYVS